MTHKADKRFLIEYTYAGEQWLLDLWADDGDDAMRKLRAAAANGRVRGTIKFTVSMPRWVGHVAGWLQGRSR